MVIINSIKIYEKACHERKNNMNADLKLYYIDIVQTMFYELITKQTSILLSILCTSNDIKMETENFIIENININDRENKKMFDIFPILVGLNATFINDLSERNFIYEKNKYDIFMGKIFNKDYDNVPVLTDELKKLDENIGHILSSFSQNVTNSLKTHEALKEQRPFEPIFRVRDSRSTDKLNQFAENRISYDYIVSEQILKLQLALQDELKQIMFIREDIDYNITKEAISQFIFIFNMLNDTLRYHPNDEKKESYHNLVESCEYLLADIEQSLAMLGVTIINDVQKPYDPEKHKTSPAGQTIKRKALIAKVLKVGFSYKNKVLEKAEVELI